MRSFKDIVAADVKGVFLNESEFAEYHEINERRVLCQVDKNLTTEAEKGLEGLFINAITVYVSADSMEKPVEGEMWNVDDENYLVRSVSEEGGMFVVVAEAHVQ